MNRLTKTYRDKTYKIFGVADDLPCGENSYDFKNLLIQKLGEYEDLEEQGLLIKLPCKVGDIFYINIQKQTYKCKISGFYISKDEIQLMVAFQDEDNKTWYETGEAHKKEDLFLTREEAEKALKE
jgi:hypothetical protein